jgi:hypothetical protein
MTRIPGLFSTIAKKITLVYVEIDCRAIAGPDSP